MRQREGRYLLRTNLTEEDPAKLWQYYMQLTQVEEAFKNLKGDLGLRPIYHQKEERIEAHIFVAFLAYCLHVTLRRWLRDFGLRFGWRQTGTLTNCKKQPISAVSASSLPNERSMVNPGTS